MIKMIKMLCKTLCAAVLAAALAVGLLPGETGVGRVKAETYQPTASDIEITKNIKALASNDNYYSAALLEDGTLYTWGTKLAITRTGNSTSGSVTKAFDGWTTPVVLAKGVKEVTLGTSHYAFIKEDGTLWMWGCNANGELGVGNETTFQYDEPVQVETLSNVAQVEMGGLSDQITAAITSDGALYTWGDDFAGILGQGYAGTAAVTTPTRVNVDGKKVKQVSIGTWTSAAVCEDGSLYMWGQKLWDWATVDASRSADCSYTPVKVLDGVKEATVEGVSCICLMEDGSLKTWGNNGHGQLGRTTDDEYDYTPTPILTNVASYGVSFNAWSFFALKKDGTLYSWGKSNSLGNGSSDTDTTALPTKILDEVETILPGYSMSGALKKDGSLYMWGGSDYTGSGEKETTPTKIMENVKLALCGDYVTFALKDDGSLWGWGSNFHGELGDFTDTRRPLPVLITLKGTSPGTSDDNNDDNDLPDKDNNPEDQDPLNTPPVGSAPKTGSIHLSGISTQIAAGKTITLTAEITPAAASGQTLRWVSSNENYATVSADGVVTVKKAGAGKKVTITAYATDGSGISVSYVIKIKKHAVKSISLKAKKQVKAGKSTKIKATVKTTGKSANKKLKWTSSNTKYATVNAKGKVKTKKAGKGKKVKITAMATDGSNKKATIKIKIK